MKTSIVAAGFVAAASIWTVARAQELPRVTKLADGVYAYEQVDPTKRGVTVNNLIVVSSEGVLIADGQGTVENTKRLVSDVTAITSQPIRYVVVGSVHGDHRGGDAAFPPAVEFIKASRGLTVGGRPIEVRFLGRSHTGSDLEVYLPRDKILFMSEVFSNRVFPSMANGYPSEWIAALEIAEQMDVDVYVPAHGAMTAPKNWTKAEVHTYRLALERVVSEGRRLRDAKVAVDDAAAAADFGEFATWTRRSENAAGALKRAYMELNGELGPSGRSRLVLDLWAQGKPVFGVYAREGGEKLGANPLYDFVFLNLEAAYDAGAIGAMAAGLRASAAGGRKTLIVRIPPIEKDGAAAARARVKEALDKGADGVTIPHIRDIGEAKQAIGFFRDAGANVWSPATPRGDTIAMLMLEDPAAVAQARAIAEMSGYSILACGIGSLTQALNGDRAAAEAGTQKVLAEATRAGLPDMLTATPQDVEKRVREGFRALLMQGPTADEAIRIGRAAAER